jgi:hypothetical protein
LQLGRPTVRAEVREGHRSDALEFAVEHGQQQRGPTKSRSSMPSNAGVSVPEDSPDAQRRSYSPGARLGRLGQACHRMKP